MVIIVVSSGVSVRAVRARGPWRTARSAQFSGRVVTRIRIRGMDRRRRGQYQRAL